MGGLASPLEGFQRGFIELLPLVLLAQLEDVLAILEENRTVLGFLLRNCADHAPSDILRRHAPLAEVLPHDHGVEKHGDRLCGREDSRWRLYLDLAVLRRPCAEFLKHR